MPLPVLPPSNTARYKMFYTVGGKQHVAMARAGIVSPSAFGTSMDAFLTALGSTIYATVVDDVQFAGSGSDIFNSVASGIEGNSYGSGTPAVVGEVAYFYDFVGRTSGGRRTRAFQYGANILGGDYRFAAGENANLDAARAVIVGNGALWLGVDGVKPTMKTYINAGVNSYWQRKVRP